MAVKYSENDLNVEYVPNFIEKDQADEFLKDLKCLPFYTPTLKIRGKCVKPKRQIIAYGDSDVSYAFSGATIPTEPWTPLMLELRNHVEKHVGCAYNYVLVNFYLNGTNYISSHRDNESSIDTTFPIAVLSFGEQRTIEFQRPGYPPTTILLEHGSLYTMHKPSNQLFTHGIPADPSKKDIRISLTFRRILPTPLKKPRLELEDDNSMCTQPATPPPKPDYDENALCQPDWLMRHYCDISPPDTTLAKWSLNWNVFALVTLQKNSCLRFHIRSFQETSNGNVYPTKKGIVMTSATFSDFQSKLSKCQFISASESFIANNQLVAFIVNEDKCCFQQIFSSKTNDYFFKPNGIALSKNQVTDLEDMLFDIAECLIDATFMKVIPQLIFNMDSKCTNHIDKEMAESHFKSCVESEVKMKINQLHACEGCFHNHPSPFRHTCMMQTLREKFNLSQQSVLLNVNPYDIVKNTVVKGCLCHYQNIDFFTQFTVESIISYLELSFDKKYS